MMSGQCRICDSVVHEIIEKNIISFKVVCTIVKCLEEECIILHSKLYCKFGEHVNLSHNCILTRKVRI